MSPLALGFWSLAAIMLFIALRLPIGVVLGSVGVLGIVGLRGFHVGFGIIKDTPFEFGASWTLTAIPMFLLMGSVAHNSGI